MRLAVLFACVLAAAPGVAGAECAPRDPTVSPRSGPLPPNLTIYAFIAGDQSVEASAPITDTVIGRAGSYAVHRVQIHAISGRVSVHVAGERNPAAWREYTIGAAPLDHAMVVDVAHHESAWTCSHTEVIAFHVVGTATALRFGWHSNDPPTYVDAIVPELGLIGCGEHTGSDELRRLRSFDLVALFADGTERTLGTSSLLLDGTHVRLLAELLGRDGEIAEKPPLVRTDLGRWEQSDPLDWTDLLAWAATLAGLLTLALWTRQLDWLVRADTQRPLPRARLVKP